MPWSFDPKRVSFFLRVGFLLFILAFLFTFGYRIFVIQGSSMSPTYDSGDITFTNLRSYDFALPQRFDKVILRDRSDGEILAKRIIGLPEEEIEIKKGKISINSNELKDKYYIYSPVLDIKKMLIPKNYYFYIGDNRKNSMWGLVRVDEIIGKVFH